MALIPGCWCFAGKAGTYSMVLLAEDLQTQLGVDLAVARSHAPAALYNLLDAARAKRQGKAFAAMEEALKEAAGKDALTHKYFDALLAGDRPGDAVSPSVIGSHAGYIPPPAL